MNMFNPVSRAKLFLSPCFDIGILRAMAAPFSLLFLAGLISACGSAPPPPPPEPVAEAPQVLEHTVRYPGETLGVIAKWYTGKSTNWNLLVEANPGLNPNRISIGDVINIPRDILVTEKPLKKSAVRSVRVEQNKQNNEIKAESGKVEKAQDAMPEPMKAPKAVEKNGAKQR